MACLGVRFFRCTVRQYIKMLSENNSLCAVLGCCSTAKWITIYLAAARTTSDRSNATVLRELLEMRVTFPSGTTRTTSNYCSSQAEAARGKNLLRIVLFLTCRFLISQAQPFWTTNSEIPTVANNARRAPWPRIPRYSR